jgi:hypothetical protein
MKRRLNEQELEQFVHRTLRSLPDRQAPRTLEARVLAEIERRAAIPWWHKSFAHWPSSVRAAFLAVGSAAVAAFVAAGYFLTAGVEASAVAGEMTARAGGVVAVATWVRDFAATLIASIPPLWFYGGLAFVGVMYLSLFGLGAMAYRTLYRNA